MTTYKEQSLFRGNICKENQTERKMHEYGVSYCSDAELIEILLGKGKTQKYVNREKAEQIITMGNGSPLKEIAKMEDVSEISNRLGIGKDVATLMLAAFEIGKRAARPKHTTERLNNPNKVATFLMPKLEYNTHEKFEAVYLNTKLEIIKTKQISEGSLSSCIVHPREVFAPAITNHAASIIVSHNHPSGDPTPSKEDIDFTASLVKAGNILSIPVLDHIIIGDGRYYSFTENGLIAIPIQSAHRSI